MLLGHHHVRNMTITQEPTHFSRHPDSEARPSAPLCNTPPHPSHLHLIYTPSFPQSVAGARQLPHPQASRPIFSGDASGEWSEERGLLWGILSRMEVRLVRALGCWGDGVMALCRSGACKSEVCGYSGRLPCGRGWGWLLFSSCFSPSGAERMRGQLMPCFLHQSPSEAGPIPGCTIG